MKSWRVSMRFNIDRRDNTRAYEVHAQTPGEAVTIAVARAVAEGLDETKITYLQVVKT